MFFKKPSGVSQLLGVLVHHGIRLKHFESYHSGEGEHRLSFAVSHPDVDHWFEEHIGEGSFLEFKRSFQDAVKSVHPDLRARVTSGDLQDGHIPLQSVVIHSATQPGKRFLEEVHGEILRRKRNPFHRIWDILRNPF